MKRFALFIGLAAALMASCSTQEKDFQTLPQDDIVFYASFEQPADEGTRVYANEDLLLRWTADDRVSIFNKLTYNQEYKFTGETGDNAGGFRKVESDEFVTGNAISHVVSVYPYQEGTKISEEEVLTLSLPSEQHYAENSFGLGANTMVSVSEDNVLQYKNVGGYLVLKLYGEGVSVSSITLRGNDGEKLAGQAVVTMPLDGEPSVVLADDALTEITLTCPVPVQLGETEEESTPFWFVIPPVSFDKGFTVTVHKTSGATFEKETSKKVEIVRNKLTKMSALNAETDITQPNNEIWYTSTDGKIVAPSSVDGFGAALIGNRYEDGKGILRFDGEVTSVGHLAFYSCVRLETVSLPQSVKTIEKEAFIYCYGMTSIVIPDSVTSIGIYAFGDCTGLTSIEIPRSVTSFEFPFILGCESLSNLVVDPENPVFDSRDHCNAIIRTENNELVSGCKNTVIPNTVTSIGGYAFDSCSGLTTIQIPMSVHTIQPEAFYECPDLSSIEIPGTVTYIGDGAFRSCQNLHTIVVDPGNPNYDSRNDCNAIVETKSNLLINGCNGSFIPNTVTRIKGYAFYRCRGLESIEIPSSVSAIEYNAFEGCSGLTSITVLSSTPPAGDNKMFYQTTGPIYVPANSVEAYKTAAYWIDYADRIQAIPSAIPVPEAVDLGLPSGVKWASWNLGATKPEEYGSFYAWGETEPKEDYSWSTYKWCGGSSSTLTKYNTRSYYGTVDNKMTLEPEDDAATIQYGGEWRMPTYLEFQELKTHCSWTYTTREGYKGYLVTGPNGNSVFMPMGGNSVGFVGSYGCYWGADLSTTTDKSACNLDFTSSFIDVNDDSRYLGRCIRAVYGTTSENVPEAIDLGLSVKWASCNLGASSPEGYGDYYAWGEIDTKDDYSWQTYKWCLGISNTPDADDLTKYNTKAEYGIIDNLTVLEAEDDVASVKLGGSWRIPTYAEWQELVSNCQWEYTSYHGVTGFIVTSKKSGYTDKFIFLPAAGTRLNKELKSLGVDGNYSSSTLYTEDPDNGLGLAFWSSTILSRSSYDGRRYGRSIRPVCAE